MGPPWVHEYFFSNYRYMPSHRDSDPEETHVSEHAALAASIDSTIFPAAKQYFHDTTNLYAITQTFRPGRFSASPKELQELQKVLTEKQPRRIMYLVCSSPKGFIHAHGVIKFRNGPKDRAAQKGFSRARYGYFDCRPIKDWDSLRVWLRYILNDPGNIRLTYPSLGKDLCDKCSTFHGDVAGLNFLKTLEKFFSYKYIPTCHEITDATADATMDGLRQLVSSPEVNDLVKLLSNIWQPPSCLL